MATENVIFENLIKRYGGELGGSYLYGVETPESDKDFFFTDEKKFEELLEVVKKNDFHLMTKKVKTGEREFNRYRGEIDITIERGLLTNPILGGLQYDLRLVKKILTLEELTDIMEHVVEFPDTEKGSDFYGWKNDKSIPE